MQQDYSSHPLTFCRGLCSLVTHSHLNPVPGNRLPQTFRSSEFFRRTGKSKQMEKKNSMQFRSQVKIHTDCRTNATAPAAEKAGRNHGPTRTLAKYPCEYAMISPAAASARSATATPSSGPRFAFQAGGRERGAITAVKITTTPLHSRPIRPTEPNRFPPSPSRPDSTSLTS